MPEKKTKLKLRKIIKWGVIILLFVFAVLFLFRESLFAAMGRYLVVDNAPEKADLIVCMGGSNITRGMQVADSYKAGLAPVVYLSRPKSPENIELTQKMGIKYPEEAELLKKLLIELQVPEDAIILDSNYVQNTLDEALFIKKEVLKKEYKSLIIITSPTHTRRCYMVFRKVFDGTDVKIYSIPAKYSKFNPEDYWEDRQNLKEVLMEYQKLLYYWIKGQV